MGRYCSPYGYALPTPNMDRLAAEGTLFRQAHCGAPTCSPSRAVLLTGETSHQSGLIGLAHRGQFRLKDQTRHLGAVLGANGFETVRAGIQHEYNADAGPIPYQIDLPQPLHDGMTHDRSATEAAVEYLKRPKDKPFFLWLGMFFPHRTFLNADEHAYPVESVKVPDPLPDTAEIRADMRNYAASLAYADECLGKLLDALEANDLKEETVVILTTDHGIDFPGMKCTLTDAGTGVALITRIPNGSNLVNETDALVSHLDVFPTVCDLLDIDKPEWLQGKSLLPVLEGKKELHSEYVFAEMNFHTGYDPCRCVRSSRYKLIKLFDDPRTIMNNIGNSPTKRFFMEGGLGREKIRDAVQLYDLHWDPLESNNLAGQETVSEIQQELEARLHAWMVDTEDPLLRGPVLLPEGALLNRLSDVHPEVPVSDLVDRVME